MAPPGQIFQSGKAGFCFELSVKEAEGDKAQ